VYGVKKEEGLLVTNMEKKYRIISIVFAKDFKNAVKRIKEAEVVDVELVDDVKKANQIGL